MLRAAAIFLVLGRHIGYMPTGKGVVDTLLSAWQRGGWVGVDLFFVLSGFLIAGLLFQEHRLHGSISFKRFFARRAFKIYPPLYFLCWVAMMAYVELDPSRIVHELLFVQNYFPGMWLHTWSLAVEEHFYLLLPPLLIILGREDKNGSGFRQIPAVFLFLAIACLAMRVITGKVMPFVTIPHLSATHLRIDSLFFGVLISYLYHYQRGGFDRLARHGGALFVLGAALLTPAFIWQVNHHALIQTFGLTFFYLGSGAWLIAFLANERLFDGRAWAVPVFIGARSYSIYLWHVWVLYFCRQKAASFPSAAMYILFCITAVLAVGVLMYGLIEQPALKLRAKLGPKAFYLS